LFDGERELAVMAAVMAIVIFVVVVIIIIFIVVIIIIATVAASAGYLFKILLTQFDLGGLFVAGALCAKCAENIFHDGSSFFSSQLFLFFSFFVFARDVCFVFS
jgi:hypothetical protein